MKNCLLIMVCFLLIVISAGCSKDEGSEITPLEANNEEIPSAENEKRNNALSYLQDKIWVFKSDESIIVEERVTYFFKSDGLLEVKDHFESGPIFLTSGKYEYSAVLDDKPHNDGIISGILAINHQMHYRFWIGEFPEYPNYLNLVIFVMTGDGEQWYCFICKK